MWTSEYSTHSVSQSFIGDILSQVEYMLALIKLI